MRLLLILFVLISAVTFAQPEPPVTYKQLTDTIFNLRDRMVVGEMQAPASPDKRLEYVAILPANIAAYRELIRQNPLITFKVHVLWQRKGTKFPAQTEAVYDSLYTYLNAPVNGDSSIRVSQFHHEFVKQDEPIKVELEVVAIAAENRILKQAVPPMGYITLPKATVLYRNYDNLVEYALSSKPADELWVEGTGLVVRPIKGGRALVRFDSSASPKSCMITLKSLAGTDTIIHMTKQFEIQELPEPTLFFGAFNSEGTVEVDEARLFETTRFYAKYEQSKTPVSVQFEVEEVHFNIGGREYSQTGAVLTPEIMKAIEDANPGTIILVTKARVKTSEGMKMELSYPFTWLKRSAKGTKFIFPEPPNPPVQKG